MWRTIKEAPCGTRCTPDRQHNTRLARMHAPGARERGTEQEGEREEGLKIDVCASFEVSPGIESESKRGQKEKEKERLRGGGKTRGMRRGVGIIKK